MIENGLDISQAGDPSAVSVRTADVEALGVGADDLIEDGSVLVSVVVGLEDAPSANWSILVRRRLLTLSEHERSSPLPRRSSAAAVCVSWSSLSALRAAPHCSTSFVAQTGQKKGGAVPTEGPDRFGPRSMTAPLLWRCRPRSNGAKSS